MFKSNSKLLITFILLITAVYIYEIPFNKWKEQKKNRNNPVAGIEIEDITRLEIEKNNNKIVLKKENLRWVVEGEGSFVADTGLINNALNSLKKAKIANIEPAGSGEDRDSFGLGEDFLINIKIYTEDENNNFFIGKSSDDFSGVFISFSKDSDIYLLGENLRSAFEKDEWRSREIFNFPKEKINKIRFQYPNREFTIELKDGEWKGTLPFSFSVNKEKIERILDIMSSLLAEEIPEQSFKGTGLEKHLIIIEASGDRIDNVLMVGEDNDKGLFYAKRADSDNIYLINEDDRNELDKAISYLE